VYVTSTEEQNAGNSISNVDKQVTSITSLKSAMACAFSLASINLYDLMTFRLRGLISSTFAVATAFSS